MLSVLPLHLFSTRTMCSFWPCVPSKHHMHMLDWCLYILYIYGADCKCIRVVCILMPSSFTQLTGCQDFSSAQKHLGGYWKKLLPQKKGVNVCELQPHTGEEERGVEWNKTFSVLILLKGYMEGIFIYSWQMGMIWKWLIMWHNLHSRGVLFEHMEVLRVSSLCLCTWCTDLFLMAVDVKTNDTRP